jgi:hypothetical protein
MKTYTQFRDGISNLLFQGWNIGDPILPDYRELIEYLEYEKSNLTDDQSEDFMGQFKIAMNVVSSYCFYVKYKVKNINKDNVNFDQVKYIHYCIGDITSKISTFEEIKMLFVFSPHQSSNIIVDSLILLSQLPFDNDESRKQFNQLVKYYQKLGDANVALKEVKLENPGSCYIATMAYGDYNHPQVIYLREYRDKKLLSHIGGKLFVKFYYWTSPYIVLIFKKSPNVNRFIRTVLDYWISRKKSKKSVTDIKTSKF